MPAGRTSFPWMAARKHARVAAAMACASARASLPRPRPGGEAPAEVLRHPDVAPAGGVGGGGAAALALVEQPEDRLHREPPHVRDEVVRERHLALRGERDAREPLEAAAAGAAEQRAEELAREAEGDDRGARQGAPEQLVVAAEGAARDVPGEVHQAPVHALVVAQLPVGVAGGDLVEGLHRLQGHEVVVGDGVGGEVGEEAEGEGLLLAGLRLPVHVEAHAPVVTMVEVTGEVLADDDVRRQRPVEELVGEVLKQEADRRLDHRRAGERLRREAEVGERAPGLGLRRDEQDGERYDCERGEGGEPEEPDALHAARSLGPVRRGGNAMFAGRLGKR